MCNNPSNTIYIAKEKPALSQNQAKFGILKFSEDLILTKENHPRSRWDLKKINELRGLSTTHHSANSWNNDYFQSARIGQEFVIEENKKAENWAHKLLENKY